jgi:hypothetical protein
MTRLVAILVTLFLVAIPAKAEVALWPRPVPGWTVIQVYGYISEIDLDAFQSYTENVNPDATLIIVTGRGGGLPCGYASGPCKSLLDPYAMHGFMPPSDDLSAGIAMGLRVRQKKLIVGVMGECGPSCALIWMGGETGRKFFYPNRPGVLTFLCFQKAPLWALRAPVWDMLRAASGSGIASMDEYLAALVPGIRVE